LGIALWETDIGSIRDSPERSGLGEPNGGGQGKAPSRVPVRANPRGVRECRRRGKGRAPGWLHQRAQNGPDDEALQFGDEFKVSFLEEWKIVLEKK